MGASLLQSIGSRVEKKCEHATNTHFLRTWSHPFSGHGENKVPREETTEGVPGRQNCSPQSKLSLSHEFVHSRWNELARHGACSLTRADLRSGELKKFVTISSFGLTNTRS